MIKQEFIVDLNEVDRLATDDTDLSNEVDDLSSRVDTIEAGDPAVPDSFPWGTFDSIGEIHGGGFQGELDVQGLHFYDSVNFSVDNANGTAIAGTYAGAVWLRIDLSAKTVTYSATGPAGATFGDNITWRRLSECAGSGKYVMC